MRTIHHTQACRPDVPLVGPSSRVISNNWRGQIISSTEYALGRSEHAWRGLREEPDVNITSVQSTYSSTISVPVSDERFDCFIPHSIIAMVKGLVYHYLGAKGSCAQPYKHTSYYHFSERDSPEASVVDSLLILSSNHFIPFSRQIYTTRNNQEPCSTTVYIVQTRVHLFHTITMIGQTQIPNLPIPQRPSFTFDPKTKNKKPQRNASSNQKQFNQHDSTDLGPNRYFALPATPKRLLVQPRSTT